jgi:glycogen operon protein
MLLAGDEFGNSQQGNNNAYAQDNETGWLDWHGLDADPEFVGEVRELIRLRAQTQLIGQNRFLHDSSVIEWWHPEGRAKVPDDWAESIAYGLLLRETRRRRGGNTKAVLVLMNPSETVVEFALPATERRSAWRLVYTMDAGNDSKFVEGSKTIEVAALSLVVCVCNTR